VRHASHWTHRYIIFEWGVMWNMAEVNQLETSLIVWSYSLDIMCVCSLIDSDLWTCIDELESCDGSWKVNYFVAAFRSQRGETSKCTSSCMRVFNMLDPTEWVDNDVTCISLLAIGHCGVDILCWLQILLLWNVCGIWKRMIGKLADDCCIIDVLLTAARQTVYDYWLLSIQ